MPSDGVPGPCEITRPCAGLQVHAVDVAVGPGAEVGELAPVAIPSGWKPSGRSMWLGAGRRRAVPSALAVRQQGVARIAAAEAAQRRRARRVVVTEITMHPKLGTPGEP